MEENTGWTLVALKEHFESLLAERDKTLITQATEYERRLTDLNHAHDEARRVLGTYLPRETWEAWQKEETARQGKRDEENDTLRSDIDSARGSRTTLYAGTGIATAIIAVMFGFAVSSGPSSSSVSQQIRTESPWFTDKPIVERRLDALEQAHTSFQLRLVRQEDLSKFFCQTRAGKLASC
jgi:hypothetical protein